MADEWKVLNERKSWTRDELVRVISFCLTEREYRYSDNLRTAACSMPYTILTSEWIDACDQLMINRNTAYYAIAEARKQWKECGEIKG